MKVMKKISTRGIAMSGSTVGIAQEQINVPTSEQEIIETRFGRVAITHENPLLFPSGPLGMPELTRFCITQLPGEKMNGFKLLQSLDDLTVSFIVLPLAVENPIIEKEDVLKACSDIGVAPENIAILVIVSVHRSLNSTKLSVNARAPIIIDSTARVGGQYVFADSKYQVQHFITA